MSEQLNLISTAACLEYTPVSFFFLRGTLSRMLQYVVLCKWEKKKLWEEVWCPESLKYSEP